MQSLARMCLLAIFYPQHTLSLKCVALEANVSRLETNESKPVDLDKLCTLATEYLESSCLFKHVSFVMTKNKINQIFVVLEISNVIRLIGTTWCNMSVFLFLRCDDEMCWFSSDWRLWALISSQNTTLFFLTPNKLPPRCTLMKRSMCVITHFPWIRKNILWGKKTDLECSLFLLLW